MYDYYLAACLVFLFLWSFLELFSLSSIRCIGEVYRSVGYTRGSFLLAGGKKYLRSHNEYTLKLMFFSFPPKN